MASQYDTREYSRKVMYDGNAAYDLAAPQFQDWEESQEKQQPVPRPAKKPQSYYSISLFSIFGFAAVVVMMVMLLMTYVSYTAAAAGTVELRSQVEELTEEQRKLTIQYEEAFDINEVEAYATTKLGMDKPADNQITNIDTHAENRAVVVNNDDDSAGGLSNLISSIVEYFK